MQSSLTVEEVTTPGNLNKTVRSDFFSHPRTSQDKSSPPSSVLSSPFKKMSSTCSYNKKLRIAMEMAAREQEGAGLQQPRKEGHVE